MQCSSSDQTQGNIIMNRKIKRIPSIFFIIGTAFTVFGIVFLSIGIIVFVHTQKFLQNSEQTEAVISRIETEYYRDSDGKREARHNVWVKYEVNGKHLEEPLGYYSMEMNEGDNITINYNPNDPSKIKAEDGLAVIGFVIIPTGSIFTILGIIFISIKISADIRKNRLIKSGESFVGIITDVKMNKTVTINNRHPYKAECEVFDPYSGEKYLYSSENISGNISNLVGKEVTVYVDSRNKKNYYVDIFELIDRYSSDENIYDYRR